MIKQLCKDILLGQLTIHSVNSKCPDVVLSDEQIERQILHIWKVIGVEKEFVK